MSLIRFAARSLFGSWFIIDGFEAFRKADELASKAEGATDKAVPLLQRVVPAAYSSSVPERAETWVRIGGACKVLGGVMYATGIGRRLGAALLVPAAALDAAMVAPSDDASAEEKKAGRAEVLKRLALLGAAIVGTMDLHGRPSLSWRAGHRIEAVSKSNSNLSPSQLKSHAKKAKKHARKQAKKAKRAAKKQAKKVQR
ncbi:DoxX family membrane protein [uncultured Tessaracoccus sp.]|uniref:DoxX family membrane protein n=1 Tax=uncultured Tessaracoccus sp. TaxID=905023 RepID=UPI002608E3D4|nr:DoxX family membrane protein [uncultured Tessaracoccus sp.]